jgi:clan AA aspartic protease
VRIRLTSPANATTMEIEAWVDTGFTGELVLPQDRIAALGLPRSAVVTAELGDGSQTVLEVYSCLIEWFGRVQQIEVIANTGTSPPFWGRFLNRAGQGHGKTVLLVRYSGYPCPSESPGGQPCLATAQ